jgi:AGZA family xanthine/uracil permease-like MFS transporter
MLFFAPFITSIPAFATAPALIFVGFLMMKMIGKIPWDDFTEAIPAYITIIFMPLTYSITHGIAFGFIAYALLKVFSGKHKELNWLTWALVAAFVLYLVL